MVKKIVMIAGKKDEIELMYGGMDKYEDSQIIYLPSRILFDNFITYKILSSFNEDSLIYKFCSRYMQIRYKKDILDVIKFRPDADIRFVIMARIFEKYGISIVSFLRKKFPHCSIYCYLADVISSFRVGMDDLRRNFERIYTFDIKEAEKYSILFCQEPFEYVKIEENPQIKPCDVTFVGKAKDRFDYLIKIYEFLCSAGVDCKFFIYGVDSEYQIYSDKIIYNYYMPFLELLQRVQASKTVLEIMQGEGGSPTTRYQEAMLYGKNLLTDCSGFDNVHYKIEDNIQVIHDIESIDIDFIKTYHEINSDYYKRLFSIKDFVECFRN